MRDRALASIDWDGGPGWNVVLTPTVQVIKVTAGRGSWAVVVFREGRTVDGRFPVIACKSWARAWSLARLRVRQLVPGEVGERWGDKHIRFGRVHLIEARNG